MRAAGRPWPRLLAVAVFAIAFAFVEATIVSYLRRLFALQYQLTIASGHFHFPHAYLWHEQAREAATIVCLLAVAWLAGRGWRARIGCFLVAFGVWDVFYYVWLYALLSWPSSPGTRDLLFLIPSEWWAPVWQPVAVSLALIAAGTALVLWRPGGSRRAG